MSEQFFAAIPAAAREHNQAQWDLADALVKEATTREKVAEIAEALDIDAKRIRKMRRTALAFPPSERRTDAGYRLHELAGDPAVLAVLMAMPPENRGGERIIRKILASREQDQ
jgi:hypothetical protein